ncbi:MAG TPA: GYD domain-containing protein [Chloroflexia bacterium]|nr:GYD domain-containing protein [Chloroflexia bacterium]
MATYVSLIQWTEQGVKNVKDTVKRVKQGQEAAEKMGGRFLSVHYTQGKYDIVITTEWPDDETANAFLLSIAATGNIRSQTMRAYSPEEMEGIISKMP